MVSGGVRGRVAGIDHRIMIMAGLITIVSQDSIMTWTHIGGDIITTITGTVTFGIIERFLIHSFNKTGRVGRVADIGKRREPGRYRAIHLNRNHKDR